MGHRRYSGEEIVRRGKALYEQQIRGKIEQGNEGKYLVIDIDTGDYVLDDDHLAASERAAAKHPDGALYAMQIGHRTLGRKRFVR